MSNSHFDFKQFSIQQDQCAMKVGTDGVLLGAWTDLPLRTNKKIHILDIGTGTGLISLMFAQRLLDSDFVIDAIDIDKEAARQAQKNISISKWCNNIHVFHASLNFFEKSIESENQKYDLIVCNPPFYNATLKPEDKARAVARHKDSLPISEIASFAKKHLANNGELSLIYPANYDNEVAKEAILSDLHYIKICDVLTKKGKPSKRRMAILALSSHISQELIREELAIRDEEGIYTREYKDLVKDFYLRLSD